VKVLVKTLGCKVNLYQSEGILQSLRARGWEPVEDGVEPDVVLVNTCTVTGEAARKSRAAVRALKRRFPRAKVVVFGCHALYAPEEFERMPEADVVVKDRDRRRVVETVAGLPEGSGEEHFPFTLEALFSRTRGLVMVEDGCDSYCSYCILPYLRGPVRSRPLDDILREARSQLESGCRELVLTGIHIGAYGKDLGDGFTIADVVERVAALPGRFRVRLSSIEVGEIDERLAALMAGGKLCPHLHVPLQSGSNRILALMNRKYTAEMFVRRIQGVRSRLKRCAVTTDVMCGFPGETEEDFEATVDIVRRVGFSRIHAFPFSPRRGTRAAEMAGRIPVPVARSRVRRLAALGSRLGEEFARSLSGTRVTVLVESYSREEGTCRGYCEYYVPVVFPGTERDVGRLVEVVAGWEEKGTLTARRVEECGGGD